jgi:hypothetical protein
VSSVHVRPRLACTRAALPLLVHRHPPPLVAAALAAALTAGTLLGCSSPEVVTAETPSPIAGGDGQPGPSPFATRVVSFTPGPQATFGQDRMPDIVFGPPRGEGDGRHQGSLDVVSLGIGGEIVLGFDQDIVDGPGIDFLVFENPFFVGDDETNVFKELGEISVSDDGERWTPFPCDAAAFRTTICGGWHPVLSTSANGVSPLDPAVAGGDPFDLADIGVARARFVKIRSIGGGQAPPNAGFDLDAVGIVHGAPTQ